MTQEVASWPRAVAESTGHLEGVTACERGIALSGWVGSNEGKISDLEATALGCTRELAELQLNLESAHLPRFFPSLEGAERANFRAIMVLSAEERDALRGQLVALTPLLEGRVARTLLNTFESRLRRPSQEELASVGVPNLNVGFEFLDYFIQMAGLRPDEDVLDVGCGMGRMAFPLVHYLGASARYEGFDVVESYIQVANDLTQDIPNFHFRTLDIANSFYNPDGSVSADNLDFPYEDESFDFAFLASVFTHLRPTAVRHYLEELRRVLRPGARCLISAFLLDDEVFGLIEAGKSVRKPIHPEGECFVENPVSPETAVGYPEALLTGWAVERGFARRGHFPGLWCGRRHFTSFQDILMLERS